MRVRSVLAAAALVACQQAVPPPASPSPSASAAVLSAIPTTPAPSPTPPRCGGGEACPAVAEAIARIDPAKLNDHLLALASVGSRDPRHPGHAQAVAYLTEQLRAAGLRVETQRAAYQGIPLENVFAFVDPPSGPPAGGWVVIAAHYDSIAARTPGWRPAVDPAPGADDNATGSAALLEYARILASVAVRQRILLAFFDGEELFFKGSAAYVQSLPRPSSVAAMVNIDMVGFNPLADRLDAFAYGRGSLALRDRVVAANVRYAIGVSPLREVLAEDPGRHILDSAPFGLAGIPAVTLTEGYADADATWPGNGFFHTVNDTPDRVTNRALWLKAAKLTLAVALELALE